MWLLLAPEQDLFMLSLGKHEESHVLGTIYNILT